MLMKAKYKYSYNSMVASYSGSGEVNFNCGAEDDPEELGRSRARSHVAQKNCFSLQLVEITELTVEKA